MAPSRPAQRPGRARATQATRWLVGAVAVVVTAAAVVGGVVLTHDHSPSSPHRAPSATGSATGSATASPTPTRVRAPRVGSCHRLSFAAATAPTDPGAAVPCGSPHTSVTIAVGRSDQVVDGHLLAVDSDRVQSQLAKRCPPHLPAYVGGDEDARRLSRFAVVWFGPTVAQAGRGADWFRCDLIALAGHDRLAPLEGRMRGVLDAADALDTWGTCGSAAPDAASFDRVICSSPHRWRARAVIGLPRGTRFLGKAASADGDARCKDVASNRAQGALKYSWSFEWPTREQWTAGQRYGYCWLPER